MRLIQNRSRAEESSYTLIEYLNNTSGSTERIFNKDIQSLRQKKEMHLWKAIEDLSKRLLDESPIITVRDEMMEELEQMAQSPSNVAQFRHIHDLDDARTRNTNLTRLATETFRKRKGIDCKVAMTHCSFKVC